MTPSKSLKRQTNTHVIWWALHIEATDNLFMDLKTFYSAGAWPYVLLHLVKRHFMKYWKAAVGTALSPGFHKRKLDCPPERHLHIACRAASVWMSWHRSRVWLKAARHAVWFTTSAFHCTLASTSRRLTMPFVCLCEAACQRSFVLAVSAPVIYFLQIQHMEMT